MADFDVVVFGATSFVGQILVNYLWRRHGASGSLRWALAGRSSTKLESVRQQLGSDAQNLPILLADASDEAALRALCARTRVVVSTVGPYALYGSPLVKVCAETGIDYCDLTGEVQWIARMIAEHEPAARKSGARIVHCCGFDSVPSDMGVYYLQQQAQQQFGEPCRDVRLRVKSMRGGASGGTVASLLNVVKESIRDASVRKIISNPFALCPEGSSTRQPNVTFAAYDDDARSWVAPFVMAGINTRIVHRSNYLLGRAYGDAFRYDEAVMTGSGLKGRLTAMGIAGALAGFLAGAALPPSRYFLEKLVPQPGEGPTPAQQEKGNYDMRLFGVTASGKKLTARVTGDRDPGYGSTAKILGEAVACLAQDISRSDIGGGFWTPSTALGQKFIDRLVANAGLTFDLVG